MGWVYESPIDRDRLFRGSFRQLSATAAVAVAAVLPQLVAIAAALPPLLGKCIQQVSTQPMSLCYVAALSPLLLLFGGSILSGGHTDPRPLDPPLVLVLPFACVKDACVDKVDQLRT